MYSVINSIIGIIKLYYNFVGIFIFTIRRYMTF
ncbi:hypothetical protein [Salmonella phage SD-1_S14]|nr:hypothetical protein [Salmonella phage SD-1_S14]